MKGNEILWWGLKNRLFIYLDLKNVQPSSCLLSFQLTGCLTTLVKHISCCFFFSKAEWGAFQPEDRQSCGDLLLCSSVVRSQLYVNSQKGACYITAQDPDSQPAMALSNLFPRHLLLEYNVGLDEIYGINVLKISCRQWNRRRIWGRWRLYSFRRLEKGNIWGLAIKDISLSNMHS